MLELTHLLLRQFPRASLSLPVPTISFEED
jgi:hypothetical protein